MIHDSNTEKKRFRPKELVINGCSMTSNYVRGHNEQNDKTYFIRDKFTDKWRETVWEHVEEFPLTGDILAEKYGMKPVNLSESGSSNEFLFYRSIDYIIENHENIGFFSMNWSNMNRWNIIATNRYNNNKPHKYTTIFGHQNFPALKFLTAGSKSWHDEISNIMDQIGAFDIKSKIIEDMRYIFLFQEFMEYYDIPYVQSSCVVSTFDKCPTKKVAAMLADTSYVDKIDTNKFWGWPMFQELGGKHLCHSLKTLNEDDGHPNAEGCRQMADRLIEFIEENNLMRK